MVASGLVAKRQGLGFGPVRLHQIVACEVIAAAAFLSWAFPEPTPYIVTPIGVLAIALLVVANAKGRGYRWGLSLRRRSLRKGAEVSREDADAVTALSPGMNIVGVTERHTECGVAFDGAGWFTGIALQHHDPTQPTGLDVETLDVIAAMLTDSAAAVTSIQLVNHLVPTPSAELEAESACTQSYAELLGADPVVLHQMTWLAVRLDIPTAARTAAERGGRSLGARRAMASMTIRLGKRLTDAGVRHQLLGPDRLRVALTHSVSGDTVSASLSRSAGERWGLWRIGTLAQVNFGVEGPIKDVDALRKLWMSMAVLPASFATIATSFHPPDATRQHQGVWMRSILRVAYDEELHKGVPEQLTEAAAECGVRLWRCDGRQAAATYASAPTGGAFIVLSIRTGAFMNTYVESGTLASKGNAVSDIGEQIAEATRRGRSLEVSSEGLETGPAFASFRDTWLGQGDKVSLDLDQTGGDVVTSDTAHSANEDAIERGYDAINRQ